MRRASSLRLTASLIVGVLFLSVAVPTALASIPTTPLRACCLRANHHSCSHAAIPIGKGNQFTSSCPCDSCERTLVTQPARPQDAAVELGIAPPFSYTSEFYGWPALQAFPKAQSQRAPPRFSIQRMKYLGGRVSATVHRWGSALWPL
jgi:hypothetical protein